MGTEQEQKKEREQERISAVGAGRPGSGTILQYHTYLYLGAFGTH